jgi:hypothetical protein
MAAELDQKQKLSSVRSKNFRLDPSLHWEENPTAPRDCGHATSASPPVNGARPVLDRLA